MATEPHLLHPTGIYEPSQAHDVGVGMVILIGIKYIVDSQRKPDFLYDNIGERKIGHQIWKAYLLWYWSSWKSSNQQ